MKLLFKVIFMAFALTQMAQAARVYDPEIGRFLSRDPMGYVDGTSLYDGYFAGKMGMDPSGTKIETSCSIKKWLKDTYPNVKYTETPGIAKTGSTFTYSSTKVQYTSLFDEILSAMMKEKYVFKIKRTNVDHVVRIIFLLAGRSTR